MSNIVNPINWSSASAVYTGTSSTSPGGSFIDSLSAFWDGEFYSGLNGNHARFVLTEPKIINELYIEAVNDGDSPVVQLFDAVGNSLDNPQPWSSGQSLPGINGGTLWRIILNDNEPIFGPTTEIISAFEVLGSGFYPQGLPSSILGIYASFS